MNLKKIIRYLGIALGIFIFMYIGAYIISPGSYSQAQYYDLEIPENKIKERVANFKEYNPQYRFMRKDTLGQLYEYKKNNDHLYFYVEETGHLFCCIINGSREKGTTQIGLYSVFYDTEFRKGGRINQTFFDTEENKKLKKEFETQVLDKLAKWKGQKRLIFF